MQQFLKKLDIGFADLYVVGLILCVGAAEAAHLAGLFLGLSIGQISILWVGVAVVLLLAWAILWFIGRRRKEGTSCHKALPLVFMGLVLIQMIYLFCMQQVVTPGDITLETVSTFLQADGIHKVNPLTGSAYVNPISTKYKILSLNTLYAVLCKLTGLAPEVLVYHMIPLFVLGGSYFAYYKLSGVLFKEHLGKRYTFLILVALLVWFMDGAVYLDGYLAMQAGYLGTSIRGLILLPWTLVNALEKKWWQCVLCVLAEACICQTLFGLGQCFLLMLLVVILQLCEAKLLPICRKMTRKEVMS